MSVGGRSSSKTPAPCTGAHRRPQKRQGARALGSLRRRATLALVLPLSTPALGCVEPDARHQHRIEDDLDIAELAIDTGAGFVLDPGSGVGIGLEYTGDGDWSLSATCDTPASGTSCLFDVLIESLDDATIHAFDGRELEADDVLWQPDMFSVRLELLTEADVDGVEFSTTPGAAVRLSVLLYDPVFDSAFDWSDDPRIVSWVGNGAVHWGAPTNPVDLRPNRP